MKLARSLSPFSIAAVAGLACMAFGGQATATGLKEVKIENRSPGNVRTASLEANPQSGSGTDTSAASSNTPLLVTVSLDQQAMTVYKGLGTIKQSRISSGKSGHSTPTGIFSILGKKKFHRSNIYSNAPMPFMQRLTWSGIALHEGRVPDYPASHGCVRLPNGFARELFNTTKHGTHVVISPEPVTPGRVNHPSLFQPKLLSVRMAALRAGISDYELSLGIGTRPAVNPSKSPLRIYVTRTTLRDKVRHLQNMLNHAGFDAGLPDGIYGTGTVSAVKAYQEANGLKKTGTMSDETVSHLEAVTQSDPMPDGMIFVRQDYKPVFEAPVTFREPSRPLGTHLLMTTAHSAEATGWIAVSLSSRLPASVFRDHGVDESIKGKRIRMDAVDALDNIIIPSVARDFIEARLTENSSFAISDNGMGTETGKGTDFIVQTH